MAGIIESYAERHRNRQQQIIAILKESKCDVWYVKTETGNFTHIVIDDYTFCSHSTGLISYWDRCPNTKANFCWKCYRNVQYSSYLTSETIYYYPNLYKASWRCSAIVKKKGKGKKKKRCSKTTNGPFDSFCLQHEKCFLKHLHKYISVSPDVCKLICGLL